MSSKPAPSGPPRHAAPVDAHLILRRGEDVLLTRRAGDTYATGLLHLPSGHVEAVEDVVTAVIREASEEIGVVIDPADVRAAVVLHHRSPAGQTRIGWFLEATIWSGTPRILEPDRCSQIDWFPLAALPDDMVAYCRAGLDAYRAGQHVALHFQEPTDAIAHTPGGPDRLRPVPLTGPRPAAVLGPALASFAERAVGPLTAVTDTSWTRPASRVWRLTGPGGGTWYLKQHPTPKFHDREVTAYRTWTGALHNRAPRLVAADTDLQAVVTTALPGHLLHGLPLTPRQELAVHRQLGQLARAFHTSAPVRPGDHPPAALEKLDRHLNAARPHLTDGDEKLIRTCAERLTLLPPALQVPTMGDLQLRNALMNDQDEVALIDFERAEYGPRTRDFVRLADLWAHRPALRQAFFDGYGDVLTAEEAERLDCEEALDALSGIAYGTSHDDPEVVERGRRTLARLRGTRP
ncbi:hypothetical protein GCM10010430_44340 [Kitasatospora cystarginea]|uniref:Nudix hydrolase domain-containing protein n=1 Tax=Kitasatospora cystarginea TaxID=58350 RepID=A0ABP5RC69_9ACTN